MAKMTQELIEKLYSYGKAVYENRLSLKKAAEEFMTETRLTIAESSAEFYIGLVRDLASGKGSTWNQNSDLLVYYVEHMTIDYGLDIGSKAYCGAIKFGKLKSRKPLIDSLNEVKHKYNLSIEDGSPDEVEVRRMQNKIGTIQKYIRLKGIICPEDLISNMYLCLKSKPFMILAGISGTGKSAIVRHFAHACNGVFKLVSVRPDWSDPSDLVGHLNLDGKFVPGLLTDVLYEACLAENKNKSYFVCLDEMNLARVEYYFSDFLSIIETRRRSDDGTIISDPIFSGEEFGTDDAAREKYANVHIAENVFIIGTVNMDETTFPFSKKVLDRANTIEFSDVDLTLGTKDTVVLDNTATDIDNAFLKSEFVEFNEVYKSNRDEIDKMIGKLSAINDCLKNINANIAYRVRNEIAYYITYATTGKLMDFDAAFDREVMQKLLPRVQGRGNSVRHALIGIFNTLTGTSFRTDVDIQDLEEFTITNKDVYPLSLNKIVFMLERLIEDDYTSYWL